MREDIYIERKIVSGRYISDGFADVLAEFEETELTPLQTAYISEKITSSNDTFVFLTDFRRRAGHNFQQRTQDCTLYNAFLRNVGLALQACPQYLDSSRENKLRVRKLQSIQASCHRKICEQDRLFGRSKRFNAKNRYILSVDMRS